MFRLVKIKGDSMWPDYRHNDYVALGRWHRRALAVGDDVVCNHAEFGLILKRIQHIGPDGLWLTGLLGNIQEQAVMGRVLWHIRRPESDSSATKAEI